MVCEVVDGIRRNFDLGNIAVGIVDPTRSTEGDRRISVIVNILSVYPNSTDALLEDLQGPPDLGTIVDAPAVCVGPTKSAV